MSSMLKQCDSSFRAAKYRPARMARTDFIKTMPEGILLLSAPAATLAIRLSIWCTDAYHLGRVVPAYVSIHARRLATCFPEYSTNLAYHERSHKALTSTGRSAPATSWQLHVKCSEAQTPRGLEDALEISRNLSRSLEISLHGGTSGTRAAEHLCRLDSKTLRLSWQARYGQRLVPASTPCGRP